MLCCNSFEEALSCSTQSLICSHYAQENVQIWTMQKLVPYQPTHCNCCLRGFFTVKTRTLKQFTSNSTVHWKISCASKVNRSIFKTNAHKMFYYACTMLNAFVFYYAQNNASKIRQGLANARVIFLVLLGTGSTSRDPWPLPKNPTMQREAPRPLTRRRG